LLNAYYRAPRVPLPKKAMIERGEDMQLSVKSAPHTTRGSALLMERSRSQASESLGTSVFLQDFGNGGEQEFRTAHLANEAIGVSCIPRGLIHA
jgi:hypothetical protein